MKISDITKTKTVETKLVEANVASKIKDPNIMRAIRIAVHNDDTIPVNMLHKLGKRPTDEHATKFLSDVIDSALSNTEYGDISKINKYDMWLVRKYVIGAVDYEDIVGEADTLALFHVLGRSRVLDAKYSDINRFTDLQHLSRVLNTTYRQAISQFKDEAKLKQMKKNKKDIVLINDGEIFVSIPLNYGACYFFNNGFGIKASYCTGSSSGETWINKYMPQGLILNVFNIKNPNEDYSKYQIHAPTNQIKSASQAHKNSKDSMFAKYYPGLMKKIIEAMKEKSEIINKASQDIKPGGYDVHREAQLLAEKFPLSYASEEPKIEPKT